jgi:hypothetical protein
VSKTPHARIFEELLVERREQVVAAMIGGALDFPNYRQLVGQIMGLNEALAISDQADAQLSGE